jgi:outer membrane protein assembly factor BamE (lipoprotein component of BamABCDE complex)
MKKLLTILIVALSLSACTLKNVEKHHGINALSKKHQDIIVNKSNKNDIVLILGSPSTKSTFDENTWYYIERKIARLPLKKLGKKKIIENNILLLEFDTKGLLVQKEFFNLANMNKLEFSKKTTDSNYRTNTFFYDLLSSMRQKINDPLGKRKR